MDPDALILLRKVAERSASEREEYYAQHGITAEVRGQVESLLKAGERTLDSFAGHVASAAVRALLEEQLTPQAAPPRPLLSPVAIGRYQVMRLIGRGGMSEVYLARDPILERDIAVKLIAGDLDGEVARRRLVREAGAVGRLRHPNIVTVFDAGEHEGQPYIAMEYVAGETLRSIIRRRDPLPLRRRLELIEGACAGLAHAHRSGVVHLDIKPDNLIVDEAGIVKVLDFGIARVLSADSLVTRHVVGTLRYMSPEQVADDPLDHRSDIFSLGSALYELITYLPAFAGSTKEVIYRIAVGPVPRLAEVMPDTDPRLDAVVSRAMALEPADRFGDIDEFRAELARLRADLDPAGDRPVEMPQPGLAAHTRVEPGPATPARALQSSSLEGTAGRRRLRATLVLSTIAAIAPAVGALWLWESESPPEPPRTATTPSLDAPAAEPPAASEAERPSGPPEVSGVTDSNEVWRRLALGDRNGVLDFLQSARAVGGDTRPAERLAYDVLSAVRTSAAQSRAAATATPGAAAAEAYQRAEARLGSANRLEAARDPLGALGLLWEASDLYLQSLTEGPPNAPVPPATPESRTLVEGAVPTPPALPSSRAVVQSLPPESLPRTRTATAAAEREPSGERPRTPSDVEDVLEALDRYRSAFQARDVSRLMLVYPSLSADQVEQLQRTFDGMAAYDVDMRGTRVQVQGEVATADAVVVRRMTPRVGSEVSNEVETRFRLRRTGAGWVITGVTAP